MKKSMFQKIWYFLWVDESFISWIVLLILAFCAIVFVFFPLSGMIFSSKLPYVVIESGSMIHKGGFDNWWESHGEWYENKSITKEQVKEFPFKNGLGIGDIIVVKGSQEYILGDIIVFAVPNEKPIIHRIVFRKTKCNVTVDVRDSITKTEEENCSITQTKGDNNDGQIPLELNVTDEQIIGKAVAVIPKAGYIKLVPCMVVPKLCEAIDSIRR